MPVSHSHRLIFIHIPKTGGTSVLRALQAAGVSFEYDGPGLWDLILDRPDRVELVDLYRRSFRVGTLANAQQQHLPASVLARLLPPEVWNTYLKVAFVRNPWDLIVSGYHYQVRTLTNEQRAVNPDVHAILGRCREFSDAVRAATVVRSDMSSFLVDESGAHVVDLVGRFERLAADFAELCRRIGVDALSALPHQNSSPHETYRSYYTQESADIIARHFKRDIERFGYIF